MIDLYSKYRNGLIESLHPRDIEDDLIAAHKLQAICEMFKSAMEDIETSEGNVEDLREIATLALRDALSMAK